MMSYFLDGDRAITGTLLWYYAICKRQVWLMARNITPDEEDPRIDLGRAIHETSFDTETKEVGLEGVKFDVVVRGKKLVYEVKTSSSFIEAARLQLKYYLYRLRELGVEMEGRIKVPREHKTYRVTLDEGDVEMLEDVLREIREIVMMPRPPPPKKIKFCSRCGYRDFCWGAEG